MNDEAQTEKRSYSGASARFSLNIAAVRILGLEISRLGDEHDQAAMKAFSAEMDKVMLEQPPGGDGTIITQVRPQSTEVTPGIAEMHDGAAGKASSEPARKLRIRDPEHAALVMRAVNRFVQRPPVQGTLLRNGALTTLVSFFEGMVSDVLHVFYLEHPEALPAESRSLSLSDLRSLGSIEDAEQFLTSKEIDALLRDSIDDQLSYFSKRLQVDLSPLGPLREELTEVFQRRNLLVHNSGVVNRHYLERVTPSLKERYTAEEGKLLFASAEYLKHALDIVHVSGLLVLQQCWRKWDKANVEAIDALLLDDLYQSLLAKNFELTLRMSDYILRVPFSSEERRRIAVVNVAIATKELQGAAAAAQVLKNLDWTACSLKFKSALAALSDEEGQLFELLPRAIAAGEITKENLREWPVFSRVRDDSRFKELL